jgi:hypothetical protein
MSATEIGLWLVGVSSLLVVIGAIVLPPDAGKKPRICRDFMRWAILGSNQ